MVKEDLLQYFLQEEPAITDPEKDKLAFLDRGYLSSPWSDQIHLFSARLQQRNIKHLRRGEIPPMDVSLLSFLPAAITEACVCVVDGQGEQHWYGRRATMPVQLWSATKFLPIYYLLSQIESEALPWQWYIKDRDSDRLFSFLSLVELIFTYAEGDDVSNSLALLCKSFCCPEELTKWLHTLTGNQNDVLQGGYGVPAFLSSPILQTTDGREITRGQYEHRGQNLVSVYSLTRALVELAWLDTNRNPDRYTLLLAAMAKDTARYIDVAVSYLSLSLSEVVILSKMGFGRSTERNRSELVYTALLSSQELNTCLTFKAALDLHDPAQEARYLDACMATAVTETIANLRHFYTL